AAAGGGAYRRRSWSLTVRWRRTPADPFAFLSSRLLSWRGKMSFLMERFRGPRRDGADESIDEFARRRAGPEVADVVADAIVTGIHAGDPKLLSMKATFPQMVALRSEEHTSELQSLTN